MKKQFFLLSLVILVTLVAVTGCAKEASVPVSAPAVSAAPAEVKAPAGYYIENAFPYIHVDGHKEEVEMLATVLFEYELLDRVKYQVAYLACTCRGPEVNYWSVAYVEMGKEEGKLLNISWDSDSTGHYTAGMYGDSTVTLEGAPAWDLLQYFVSDQLLNKPQEYVNSIEAMHGDFSYRTEEWKNQGGVSGEHTDADSGASFVADTDRAIDDYTGATVTPNNVARMVQGLMTYHNERYM